MAKIDARDIKQNGNHNTIQVIGTSVEEGKPLAQCTPDELRQERAWRNQLLANENHRVLMLMLKLLAWLLCGGGAAYVSHLWVGISHWLTLTLVAAGIAVPSVLFYHLLKQGDTEFALRQQATLKEIAYLLREKGTA